MVDFDFKFHNQSVLKIDVQGLEVEVLKGATNSLKIFDLIIIECSFVKEYLETEPSFSDIVELLKKNNFIPSSSKITANQYQVIVLKEMLFL